MDIHWWGDSPEEQRIFNRFATRITLLPVLVAAIVLLMPRCHPEPVLGHAAAGPYRLYLPIVTAPEAAHVLPGGW